MSQFDLPTTLDWVAIAEATASSLLALPGIEIVHPFLRFEPDKNAARFSRLFVPTGSNSVDAWVVERRSQEETWLTMREMQVDINTVLTYWYTVDDEAESWRRFNQNVDTVMDFFRREIQLQYTSGGSTFCLQIDGPPQLPTSDFVFYVRDLCQRAEVSVNYQVLVLSER